MDITELQKLVSVGKRGPVKKVLTIKHRPALPESEWADPEIAEFQDEFVESTTEILVRKQSSADSVEILTAEDRLQAFVSAQRCVLKMDGQPLFPTLEDAMEMPDCFLFPIMKAVNEVNGVAPKKSQPRMSGGANSRLPSAVVRSNSGRKSSSGKKNISGDSTAQNAEA